MGLLRDPAWAHAFTAPVGSSDQGVYPHAADITRTLWIAAALLLLRFVCDRTIVPLLRSWLARHGRGDKAMHVFDDMFIVCWAVATEVFALYVVCTPLNGGCKPWDTDACLTGWPHHALSMPQRWYMLLMFQGYLHELVGGLISVGPKLRKDMVVHHLATMTLISTAYLLNLSRFGIMWQALFDISNPLLHAAKMLNTMSFPLTEAVKWYVFTTFALTFFVARIVMAPVAVIWPAVTRSTKVLPGPWAVLLMAMLVIVCGIQWLWFYKIVKLATGAEAPPKRQKKVL